MFSTFNINSPSPRKFIADDAEEEKNTPDVSVAVAEDSLLKVQDAELLNDRGVASSHGSGTTSHGSKDSVGGGGAAGKTNSHYGGNMLTVSDVPDWSSNASATAGSPTGTGTLDGWSDRTRTGNSQDVCCCQLTVPALILCTTSARSTVLPVSSPTRRPDHMPHVSSSSGGGGFDDAASDLTSIKSEESTDSENFVIVGQAEDPDAAETALFNIHSKRASPVVEVAAEVTKLNKHKKQ